MRKIDAIKPQFARGVVVMFPFLTALAATILHEPIGWGMIVVSMAVVLFVFGAKRFAG